jgi:hypothetical protein
LRERLLRKPLLLYRWGSLNWHSLDCRKLGDCLSDRSDNSWLVDRKRRGCWSRHFSCYSLNHSGLSDWLSGRSQHSGLVHRLGLGSGNLRPNWHSLNGSGLTRQLRWYLGRRRGSKRLRDLYNWLRLRCHCDGGNT